MKRICKGFILVLAVFRFFSVQALAANDYPYANSAMNQVDSWKYYTRNCTSFVAWCLNSRNGIEFHNRYGGVAFGHANTWGNAARQLGISVDNVPAVGSVAWFDSNVGGAGAYGHVAWVADIQGSQVTIEEYNYGTTPGVYHMRSIPITQVSGYIHFKDVVRGWVKNESDHFWRYWKTDGSQATGWQQIDGKYYFFHTSGEMAVGWLELDDGYYYLGSNGTMYAGRWITEDGNRYYAGTDGRLLRNVCSRIDGVEYDFDDDGVASVKKADPIPTQPETKPAKEETTSGSRSEIEYSYRTRTKKEETKTSEDPDLSGWECVGVQEGSGTWGSWSGWSDEYRESSGNVQVETRTVSTGETTQIYLGRYYSASKNKFSPSKLDSTYTFEGGWFEEDTVTFVGQAYVGGRSDCYTVPGYHYYFFEIGSHGGETRTVSAGTKTEYRYRQKSAKTIYQYQRTVYTSWFGWSAWSENPVEENECTEVKTRNRAGS
ncbi:MAG: CHAP domain-containing protein [Hungatella sp.]|jgi:surface antigen|nr:CHAP domain-containing protein [Hungatella sp.]